MDVKIKICGLTRMADIETVNRLKPDYIGFVFYPPSKRYLTLERAEELYRALDRSIRAVGVFVDCPSAEIIKYTNAIDLIQLHGAEEEEDISFLKRNTYLPVIKAVSMTKDGNTGRWDRSEADYLLLDSGAGGTGTVFDHGTIGTVKKPFFLAGGLGPENVEEAVRTIHPYAVDMSSGVETDGIKDASKIEQVIRRIRKQ